MTGSFGTGVIERFTLSGDNGASFTNPSTANTLPYFTNTTGNLGSSVLQYNSSTGDLIFPSTSGGWIDYLTVDQVTNYQQVYGGFNTGLGTYQIGSLAGGTLSPLSLTFGVASTANAIITRLFTINPSISSSPSTATVSLGFWNFYTNTTGAGYPLQAHNSNLSAASGTQYVLGIIPKISQTSTAGYTCLFISPFESTTGSGSNYLINVGTNSAVNMTGTHTSLFNVTDTGAIGIGAKISTYSGVATAGFGVPAIYGAGLNVSLNTTSTAVASYTPTASGGQNFMIKWVLSCKTSSTPTLQVTFTDPNAGAQTITLYNTAMTSNNVTQGAYVLVATSAAAIAVTGSDSVALGDIYATATIEEIQ